MAKPLRVWSGSEWVDVSSFASGTTGDFLTPAAAASVYFPISSSVSNFGTIKTLPATENIEADLITDEVIFSAENGIILNATASADQLTISTNATWNNTASAIVMRDGEQSFDITKIDFDTTKEPGFLEPGELEWNLEEGTLDLGMSGSVVQSIGMKFYMPPVKNQSGELINAGNFVMATGAQGDRITIAKAVTNGTIDPQYMIGVAAQDIPDGSEYGLIIVNGTIKDINTASWAVGTILYPDPNISGGLTDTIPSAPAIKTSIAIVLRQHAETGRIYVRMDNGSVLGGTDSNVEFTTLADNHIITYNQSSSYWTNQGLADAIQEVDGAGSGIDADLLDGQQGSYYAPIDSPSFTGSADFTSAVVYGVFPDVAGNSGKYLYTDGTDISWQGLSTPFTAFEYIATASQTSFSGFDDNGILLQYEPNNLNVYVNGVLLTNNDYVATSGSSIVLTEAAVENDDIAIVAFGIIEFADVYTRTEVDNNFLLISASSNFFDYAKLESPVFTGYPTFKAIKEDITASPVFPPVSLNFDVSDNNSILYYTAETSGNWALNVRGNSTTSLNSIMNDGESITIAFLCVNGSAGYYQTSMSIDGISASPRWQGGSVPTEGTADSLDIYSFTIIKTASAEYTILGSLVGFA